MDDLSQLRRGRFSLGTSDTTALYFIPALVKEFRGAHPNVEMVIHNRASQEIVRRVIDATDSQDRGQPQGAPHSALHR